jgi:hypothetical protein
MENKPVYADGRNDAAIQQNGQTRLEKIHDWAKERLNVADYHLFLSAGNLLTEV